MLKRDRTYDGTTRCSSLSHSHDVDKLGLKRYRPLGLYAVIRGLCFDQVSFEQLTLSVLIKLDFQVYVGYFVKLYHLVIFR